MRWTNHRLLLCGIVALLLLGGVVYFATRRAHPMTEQADKILIEKAARRLTLLRGGVVLKTYRVTLGPQPVGPKQQEGDGRTPEGRYLIDWRNPNSKFHLSLHINYPDTDDQAQAVTRGVAPGGDIMIHGLPNANASLGALHYLKDWTLGCIAVSNQEIEEIWHAVPDGTPVEIVP